MIHAVRFLLMTLLEFFITKRTQNNHAPSCDHKTNPKGSGNLRTQYSLCAGTRNTCIRSKRDNCTMNESITR